MREVLVLVEDEVSLEVNEEENNLLMDKGKLYAN